MDECSHLKVNATTEDLKFGMIYGQYINIVVVDGIKFPWYGNEWVL